MENFLPKFDVAEWNIISEDYSSIFRDDFNYELQLIVGLDYLVLTYLNIEKSIYYFKMKNYILVLTLIRNFHQYI